MFVISKAWKVAVRLTKPTCCHYRLLDGTSTLPFAQIGLRHQEKMYIIPQSGQDVLRKGEKLGWYCP